MPRSPEQQSNQLEEEQEVELTLEQEEVKNKMVEALSKRWIDGAIKIKNESNLPEEVIQSPKVREVAKKRMIFCLSRGYIDEAIKIIDEFKVPKEMAQQVVKEEVIYLLSQKHITGKNSIEDAIQIKNRFSLSKKVIQSQEVQQAAKNGLIKILSNGFITTVIRIIDEFNLSLSPEFVQSSEVQQAAEKGIYDCLFVGYATAEPYSVEQAIKIRDEFMVPEEIAQEVAKEGLINNLSHGYIDHAVEIIDEFSLPKETVQQAVQEGLITCLSNNDIGYAISIKNEFNISDNDFAQAIKTTIEQDHMENILQSLDSLPEATLKPLEKEYYFLSYKNDLNIPSKDIYNKYVELKRAGDEVQLAGYVEKTKEQVETLISSEEQDPDIVKQENYQPLIEVVYPNHADNWTNFENNESCLDRSSDLEKFKVREVYEINLSEGIEMELKSNEVKDEQALASLEKPIAKIQERFTQVEFEKDKMFELLDSDLDKKTASLPHAEVFKTREEKIYGLLLESLVGRYDANEVKEVLIGYQFAQFEDIRTYLEGTRAQAEQAKSPDYAYLLELREFFADHIKEVERKITQDAQNNPEVVALLPEYYQEKQTQEKQAKVKDQLNRLQAGKLGLEGGLLERILKELQRTKAKKGRSAKFVERVEDGEIKLGAKGKAIAGMIMGEQRKAVKVIEALTDEGVDPETVHLGELSLTQYLEAQEMVNLGKYDEELFSSYLVQTFQGIFEKEMTTIDQELAKYQPKEEKQKNKQQRQLECYISKNHTSAHARGVAGVCVSGDNPMKAEQAGRPKDECQWNMPNYLQMVLRDKENKVCQGVVLLHYYEDQGKKVLTGAFNPSSTYLYKVDETQLFKGLLEQLAVFAQDNDIDIISVSQNKTMRTNRTGGEFERAMEASIKKQDEEVHLSKEEVFSYEPDYKQKDLDVIWKK